MALAKPPPIRILFIKTVIEGQRARDVQWLEASWRSYLDRRVIRRGLREGLLVWLDDTQEEEGPSHMSSLDCLVLKGGGGRWTDKDREQTLRR